MILYTIIMAVDSLGKHMVNGAAIPLPQKSTTNIPMSLLLYNIGESNLSSIAFVLIL